MPCYMLILGLEKSYLGTAFFKVIVLDPSSNLPGQASLDNPTIMQKSDGA